MSNYRFGFSPPYMAMPCAYIPDKGAIMAYLQRTLMRRVINVFKWKMPDWWDKDYFLYTLYSEGFCVAIYTNEFGLIPQRCGLLGNNEYDVPSAITCANAFVQVRWRRIGDNCVLFRLRPDYGGMYDIVNFYAQILSEMYLALIMNLRNSKAAYILSVADNKEAKTIRKLFEEIDSGNPRVYAREKVDAKMDNFTQNVRQNYIGGELMVDIRKAYNDFDNAIGIGNANTEKKERQIVDEVNANNEETLIDMEGILERLQGQCDMLNKMYGKDLISVDWRYKKDAMLQQDSYTGGNDRVQ